MFWTRLPYKARIAIGWAILVGTTLASVFGSSIELQSDGSEGTARVERAVGLFGVIVFQAGFYLSSSNRSQIPWPTVIIGLFLQQIVALFVLKTDAGFSIFNWLITLIRTYLNYSAAGIVFLTDEETADKPWFITHMAASIIFFMATVEGLYYFGVLQWVMRKIGWFFFKLMNVSGAEAVVASGSPLVGQGESVLLVKPYVNTMTKSELHLVLASGYSTVSASFVVAYLALGVPARNLITSSVMSIPASIAISKIRCPEIEEPLTRGTVVVDRGEDPAGKPVNILQALFRGSRFGMMIVGQVIANTLVFLAMITVINGSLTWIGLGFGIQNLTLQTILGYVFYPLAFLIGIPRQELLPVAKLLATKFTANELIAYAELQTIMQSENPLSNRAFTIASYALCGFANLSSLAVQSVICAVAPDRTKTIVSIAFSALICGYVSTLQTAAIA
ncbi:hypothetical protein PM082_004885 [Marasmius tenuissimus]|nr:hypothetical protein PM082_004885 [Marasmius tenuissimus]